MIEKILGTIDIIITIALFSMMIKISIPLVLTIIIIIVLLAKSLPFIYKFDIGSIIDIVVAAVFLISIFLSLPIWILFIAAAAIGQKGFFSLL